MADERTFGQLVADATSEVSTIMRQEIELAKAELAASAKNAAAGGALFGAAGYFVFLAVIIFVISGAYGLVAAGLAPWLAFLIVGVVLVLLAGICALIGRGRFKKVAGPKKAIASTQATVEALKHHDATAEHVIVDVREPAAGRIAR
jgi:membrane protein implicated in regulation of membrane protease activity